MAKRGITTGGFSPAKLQNGLSSAALIGDLQGGAPIVILMEHVRVVLRKDVEAVDAAVLGRVGQGRPPLLILCVHHGAPFQQRFCCARPVCTTTNTAPSAGIHTLQVCQAPCTYQSDDH